MDTQQHETVLLHEAINALNLKADGVYVDGTFGRGGHTKLLLDSLGDNARVIAIDRDNTAIAYGREKFNDPRLELVHGTFSSLPEVLAARNLLGKVDGILFDLGVSSPQLDNGDRGFSFMKEGPLDMRMNQEAGVSASEWLQYATETEIADVLWQYGQERRSRHIARTIVQMREEKPIETTADLVACVVKVLPNNKKKHPATRTFQAIRIFINRELEEIKLMLSEARDLLKIGGRLVVISFHSLEDRLVKVALRQDKDDTPSEIPILHKEIVYTLKEVVKRVKPSAEEIKYNPRSRSAVMRVAERFS